MKTHERKSFIVENMFSKVVNGHAYAILWQLLKYFLCKCSN